MEGRRRNALSDAGCHDRKIAGVGFIKRNSRSKESPIPAVSSTGIYMDSYGNFILRNKQSTAGFDLTKVKIDGIFYL